MMRTSPRRPLATRSGVALFLPRTTEWRLEVCAGSLRQGGAQLVHEDSPLDFAHFPFGEVAELERTERQADQPRRRQSKAFEDALHLAVLALTEAEHQPDVA